MPDPVDFALKGLRKPGPIRRRLLTFRHQGSGAEKRVEYLGTSGIPLRAQVHWPIAGTYLVAPRSGRLIAGGARDEALKQWVVAPEDHHFLKEEWRIARARMRLPTE